MANWRDTAWDGYTAEALAKRRADARYQCKMRWFAWFLAFALWGLILLALLVKF